MASLNKKLFFSFLARFQNVNRQTHFFKMEYVILRSLTKTKTKKTK